MAILMRPISQLRILCPVLLFNLSLACKIHKDTRLTEINDTVKTAIPIFPETLIDGSSLIPEGVILEEYLQGSHHALKISVETESSYDFARFYICSTLDPRKCNPPPSTPYAFQLSPHIFYSAPEGNTEVKISLCVRKNHAKPMSPNCGQWVTATPSPYLQKANSDQLLQKKMEEKYALESQVSETCHELTETLSTNQETLDQNPDDFSQPARNIVNLGEDYCAAFVKSGQFDEKEEKAGEQEDDRKTVRTATTEKQVLSKEDKVAFILGIGLPLALATGGYGAWGLYELRKKYNIYKGQADVRQLNTNIFTTLNSETQYYTPLEKQYSDKVNAFKKLTGNVEIVSLQEIGEAIDKVLTAHEQRINTEPTYKKAFATAIERQLRSFYTESDFLILKNTFVLGGKIFARRVPKYAKEQEMYEDHALRYTADEKYRRAFAQVFDDLSPYYSDPAQLTKIRSAAELSIALTERSKYPVDYQEVISTRWKRYQKSQKRFSLFAGFGALVAATAFVSSALALGPSPERDLTDKLSVFYDRFEEIEKALEAKNEEIDQYIAHRVQGK
ncbi:MAG: hypothetical protein HYW48_07785 [Deltaproteobacteria bacterium]|nr:hypothetical protein [Deltaproteobacteria bacterium]